MNPYSTELMKNFNKIIFRICFVLIFAISLTFCSESFSGEMGSMPVACFDKQEILKGMSKDDTVLELSDVVVFDEEMQAVSLKKMKVLNRKNQLETTFLFDSFGKGCIIFAEKSKVLM